MLGQCYLETYDLEMRRQSNKIGQLILIFNNKDTREQQRLSVFCLIVDFEQEVFNPF